MAARINTTTLHLQTVQPFDFAATIDSHGWIMLAPNRWDARQRHWRRVERLRSGKVVLINARPRGNRGRVKIQLDIEHPGRLRVGEQEDVLARIAHMLRIDEDFSEFFALCANHPRRQNVCAGAGRLLRSADLFEDLVKTLCTTNIQWGGTCRMVENLVNDLGESFAGDATLKAFPSAQAIAALPLAEFKARVNLGYRSDYVHLLAQRITTGELDLDDLRDPQLDTTEVRRRLLAIKGIGGYAAATLLMLLGHYDQLPVDSVFRQFVSRHYFDGLEVTDRDAQAIYAHWGRWKYLAYWFDIWPGHGWPGHA